MSLRLLVLTTFLILTGFYNNTFSQQGAGLQWAGSIGGSGYDMGNSITTDDQYNIYITGKFSGTTNFDFGSGTSNATSNGSSDIFIQKLDFAGNLIWVKTIGGSQADNSYDINLDFSGNIYVIGTFQSTVDFNTGSGVNNLTATSGSASAGTNGFVLKLDSSGNFIWVKRIGSSWLTAPIQMALDSLNNIFLTGYFYGVSDMNPSAGITNLTSQGNADVFVEKLDSNGNFLWAKSTGGTSTDWGSSIKVDNIGNIFLTGNFQDTVDFNSGSSNHNLISNGFRDVFVQKLDPLGNFIWAKRFGGATDDNSYDLVLDSLSNIYVTGYFSGTVDFDVGAGISNQTSVGFEDIFIQKLDSSGNFQWVNTMGGVFSYDKGFAVTTNNNGGIYFGGFIPLFGGNLGLIQKLDYSGNIIWGDTLFGWVEPNGLHVDEQENIYSTGKFRTVSDFDPDTGVFNLTPHTINSYDIFVLKLSNCTPTTGTEIITACNSYTWIDGVTYTSSNNTATHSIANSGGCDSVVTLNLTINSVHATDTYVRCAPLTWIDGTTYNISNNTATHVYTGVLANGCDSIVHLDLTINAFDSVHVISACDSYTWINNITYTSSNNTASQTFTNAAGCDSVLTLDLTMAYSNTAIDTVVACSSYTWINSVTYTSSNSLATHTLTNNDGCDSVVTLNLTINYPNTYTDIISACSTYTWINGSTYSSSNSTATHTLTNTVGCDSVVTLNLTILNTATAMDVQSVCDSLLWLDGNTYYVNNTTATHTLLGGAANGCDSIITLNLSVNSNAFTDVLASCDTLTWINGVTYTASNNSATHILTNAAGCDSLVSLDLTITYSSSSTDVISECDSYTWIDGNTYTSSNTTATHTVTNAIGCDSIITLDLTINFSFTATDVVTACDTFTWINGTTYTANNSSATHTLTSSTGCDSVVTLDLTINTVNVLVNTVDLTLTASATNAIYQWLDCNDNYAVISGETNNTYTVTLSGNYAVEVTQNGCTDTSICYLFTNVGVNDIHVSEDIKVYPNPTSDYITIDLQKVNASLARVVIVDFTGQTIFQENIAKDQTPWTKQVDLSSFASGVYFVKVIIGEEEFTYQVYKL